MRHPGTVSNGKFSLSGKEAGDDCRYDGLQVAAVDTAGNVGPRSQVLKVFPKVVKLTLAAAKAALKKRGFKTGAVTYKTSTTVPSGKVVKGTASGLRPAGSKIGLRRS